MEGEVSATVARMGEAGASASASDRVVSQGVLLSQQDLARDWYLYRLCTEVKAGRLLQGTFDGTTLAVQGDVGGGQFDKATHVHDEWLTDYYVFSRKSFALRLRPDGSLGGDMITTLVRGPFGTGNIYYDTCAVLSEAKATPQ